LDLLRQSGNIFPVFRKNVCISSYQDSFFAAIICRCTENPCHALKYTSCFEGEKTLWGHVLWGHVSPGAGPTRGRCKRNIVPRPENMKSRTLSFSAVKPKVTSINQLPV